jgi:putative ABC transport system substrate-binding protein
MDRRSFVRTAATGLFFIGSRVHAGALPRVAIVFNGAAAATISDYPWYKAFVRGLRERGLEDGRDIEIVSRSADGQLDRLPKLMQELIDTRVAIIVAIGPAFGAAWRATRTIPIVAVGTDDLIEVGAVASLARPGGNVTGLTAEVGLLETSAKRLQLLHEAAPKASRVAVLGYALRKLPEGSAESAARTFELTLVWADTRTPEDLKAAFGTIEKAHANALYIEAQPINYRHAGDIASLAARLRLPSIFEFREGPEHGGLMSYASDYAELFRRAATFVDKVLKGAKPADLPIEQPTKFDLVINMQTARALDITIPQSLRTRAELIE